MKPENNTIEERHATFAVDWLEYRARIEWNGYQFNRWFSKLQEVKRLAKANGSDEPIHIGKHILLLAGSGMGQGRASHFEYRFTIGELLFAVSGRDAENMRHPNLYVKITGGACLLYGVERCRNIVDQVVEELGGGIVEDAVSRVDVCLDVVGLSLNSGIQQACEQGWMLGSLLKAKANLAFYGDPRTGVKLGSKKSVQLDLYDKVAQATKKHAAYVEGMIKHRWNGRIPEAATRVEYQVSRDWLRRYGLVDVDGVLRQLPDIVAKLTSVSSYPLFVVTESKPDRKNNNQQRSGVHPDWQWVVDQFKRLAGSPTAPLEAIQRGTITLNRAHSFIRGMLTSAAAQLGMACESAMDACNVLLRLEEAHCSTDDDWARRWTEKAIRAGTYQDLVAFDFGKKAEAPVGAQRPTEGPQ